MYEAFSYDMLSVRGLKLLVSLCVYCDFTAQDHDLRSIVLNQLAYTNSTSVYQAA